MTIDCIVLSPVDDECHSVFDQWQNKAEYCDFIDTNYLSIQLSMGHVFFCKVDLSIYKECDKWDGRRRNQLYRKSTR